jgi:hypothetical protein
MSSDPTRRVPWRDLRPSPVDERPEAPLPADGSGVVRLEYNIYEWELEAGHFASAIVYGDAAAPDAIYAMTYRSAPAHEGADVAVDPRILPVWERDGMIRPDNRYTPISDEAADEIVARYLACSREERSEAWRYYRSIRERLDGGALLELETQESEEIAGETDFALYEIDPDGTAHRLYLGGYDQTNRFLTADEHRAHEQRVAEREAAVAAGLPDPFLPF